MNPKNSYEDVLRRHALPEVLFPTDIALALDLPEAEADARAQSGYFGPRFYVAGRVAVLRQDFLDHLVELGAASDCAARELLPPRIHAVESEFRDDR